MAIPLSSLAAETGNPDSDNIIEEVIEPTGGGRLTLITSTELEAEFERAWFKRYKEGADLNKVIDGIVEIMLNSGITNLPDYSSALVVEAKQAFKDGDSDKAVSICQLATKLSPRMSKFYFELSEMYFRAFNLVDGINTYIKAAKIRTNNFIDSRLYRANIFIYLSILIVAFITIFILIVSIKYLKLFYHDITHIFPLALKGSIIKLYTIIFLFLPLFMTLGLFWQAIFLILLCFIYGTQSEKKICYTIVILLALLPFIITSTLKIFTFIDQKKVNEIYRANEGTWYFDTEVNLESRLAKHPDDTDLLLSLGLVSKRRRDFSKAEKYYLKGLALEPDSYELNLNLGNVYLAQERVEWALSYYKKAEGINPDRGTVHYNLSTLYLKLVMLEDAEKELQKARKLSPDIVDYYSEVMNTSSPNFNRLVIDELVSKESYQKRYNEYSAGVKSLASKILPYQIKALPYEDIPFVVLALLVILIIIHVLNKSYAFTSVCQKCGGAVCYKCQRTIKDNKLCSQCFYIVVRREGVDPKSRIIKMLQIKNYIARRILVSKLLTLIFPGAGHIYKGLTARGITYSVIALVLGINLLAPRGFIDDLYVTGVTNQFFTFGSYIILILFIVNYLISFIDILRSE